jgi:hypothetical protein
MKTSAFSSFRLNSGMGLMGALIALLLPSCGGGGGSTAPTPGGGGNAYFESLNGDYVVEASAVDLDSDSSGQAPTGLESTVLRVKLFAVAPNDGEPDGYAGAYSLEAPGLDFRSLAKPAPNGSAIAVAWDTPPDGTFWMSGIHYFAAADVTVELSNTWFDDLSTTVFLSDGFAKRFRFRVFAGNRKAVEHESTNEIDDDGDGLVDEADEDESFDVIDPSATPIREGRLTLSFRR